MKLVVGDWKMRMGKCPNQLRRSDFKSMGDRHKWLDLIKKKNAEISWKSEFANTPMISSIRKSTFAKFWLCKILWNSKYLSAQISASSPFAKAGHEDRVYKDILAVPIGMQFLKFTVGLTYE